jgi:hypothetical protein
MPSAPADKEIVLSLISHTNVGKTALARTLLRRDVGEVADSAHVTLVPEAHTLLEAEGRHAKLWDTPGFGANLAKLAKRLRASDNPVGWLLHQVWDRVADRSLWCSQEAVRNVQAEADLVLYLVDASQPPEATAYIDLELEVIEWIGKPVLVLLNQTGVPEPAREARLEGEWRERLSRHPVVRRVSTLDAFTRCWITEHRLFDDAADLLGGEEGETARLLGRAWLARQLAVFDESVAALATLACASLRDTEALADHNLVERLLQWVGKGGRDQEFETIQRAMYARLAERTKATMNRLIPLHGLDGESAAALAAERREALDVRRKLDESLATAMGGAGTGLLGGLVADLAAGGMTFGGGAFLGMVAGGLASYALVKGYNLVLVGDNRVRWTSAHFREQLKGMLMLYLAVAHFGRGRGSWRDPATAPSHWEKVVSDIVDGHEKAWNALWKSSTETRDEAALERAVAKELRETLVAVLRTLYPGSSAFLKGR